MCSREKDGPATGGGSRREEESGARYRRRSAMVLRQMADRESLPIAPACSHTSAGAAMLVDCHVHVNAFLPANGRTSKALLGRPSFRYLRWRLGMKGADGETERALVSALAGELEGGGESAAAGVPAFWAGHWGGGGG